MRTLYFTILFLVASVLVFPQEVIKEKVNINPKITGGIIFDGCSYGFYDSTEVEVRFVPASISPGDTALMQLWIHAQDYEYEINDDQWDIIQRNITVDPSYGTVSKRSDGEYQFIALKNIPDSVTNMLINYETYSAACIILGKFSNPNNLSAVSDSVGKSVKILAKLNGTNGCIDCGYSPSGLLRLYGSGVIQLNTEKLVAYLDRDTLSPGDTANILIKSVDASGNTKDYPDTTHFEIGVINGCGLGNILDSNGNMEEYFANVLQPLKFVVNMQADVDTATIVLRVGAPALNAANSSIRTKMLRKTPIREISSLAVKLGLPEMVIKKVANVTDDSYCIPEGNFQVSNFTTTQSKFVNQKTILLGESKYYYVTNDNGKLTINETTDPSSNPGLSNATFDNPVAAKGSEKNPVYWEYKYPIYGGNTFTGMNTLSDGMIRLVGRYWDSGKTYKTQLTAHNPADGQSASIVLEVKKPVSLGNSHRTAEDVFGHNVNIDSLIIKSAGEYGIPPQLVKGQIEHETNFKPAYRYEPWQDIYYQSSPSIRQRYFGSNNNFVVTNSGMGNGPGIPGDHIYVPPVGNYVSSPSTIREFLANTPLQYVNTKSLTFFNDATITSYWKMYFKQLRKKKPRLDKQTLITQSLMMTMDSFRDIVFGKGEYDSVAQTRIMASYGFLQLTHYNATDLNMYGFTKTSSTQPPEFLNDESYNFRAYSERMIKKLKLIIGTSLLSSNWTQGYEEIWSSVLKTYNPGEMNYNIAVLKNSQNYLPLTGE